MQNVLKMDRDEFLTELSKLTTPEKMLENAKYPYRYLSTIFKQNCIDSVLREWSFQWTSEQLNIDYDVIYNKWLGEFTL